MSRRPWLVIVVLVLLAISATMFVKGSRAYRPDDAFALSLESDAAPCEAPALPPVHESVAVVEETPLLVPLVTATAVLALAPKTSPPR